MTPTPLRALLSKFPTITVAVVGDFFLDQYLLLDERLNEVSLETGLVAYQVVEVRASPGAAGTVTSNLRALGVRVAALGIIGDDGAGLELERGLHKWGMNTAALMRRPDRFTPTYTKPVLRAENGSEHELNRLDIKNRAELPPEAEGEIIARLREMVPNVDGLIVVDQVEEMNCGVITPPVRAALAELGATYPEKVFAVESRAWIGEFRNMILKPNAREALAATGQASDSASEAAIEQSARELFRRARRPVFLTRGESGMLLCEETGIQRIPTVHTEEPIDTVGAGDSALAGITAALCAGATRTEAALIGNLVASITIRQVGTTGTATSQQVLAAAAQFPSIFDAR